MDTESFASGIRNAMRQDPEVIFIGEIRDRDSIQAAMQAAETGHLVLATLHADSVTPVADNWSGVERYLVEDRKLPATLLNPLVQSGTLYADARGNAVFLLLDTTAIPVGAELRGTMVSGWRGMAPGSRKDRGFFSVAASTSGAIVLCESAIDALSCHALHPGYLCLSTSGARPDPAWLPALIAKRVPIYCGFDADPTGDTMAQHMQTLHPSILRLRPPAKDWNDLLRQRAR